MICMDDILNDLIITDGKERPAKKQAAKKSVKKTAVKKEKPVTVEPVSVKPKYSTAELNMKGITELRDICAKLGIPASRRKVQLINNILNNN